MKIFYLSSYFDVRRSVDIVSRQKYRNKYIWFTVYEYRHVTHYRSTMYQQDYQGPAKEEESPVLTHLPLGSLTPTLWFMMITSVSSSGIIRDEASFSTRASIGLSTPAGIGSLSNSPSLRGLRVYMSELLCTVIHRRKVTFLSQLGNQISRV